MNRIAVALIAVAVLSAPGLSCRAARPPSLPVLDSYPLLVVPVDKLSEVRTFHERVLGLDSVFDSSWFVALGDATTGNVVVAFMSADHPASVPGPQTFSGPGALLTVQVPDARSAAQRATKAGATLTYGPVDEPWGQRRFVVEDPAGLTIDVVEQIAPTPGYWERFPARPRP